MEQSTTGLVSNLADILEQMPSFAAALTEGKIAAELAIQNEPEGASAETLRRLELVNKGLEAANELIAFVKHGALDEEAANHPVAE